MGQIIGYADYPSLVPIANASDCCGEGVTKSINYGLESTIPGGKLLPSDNLGVGIPKYLAKNYNVPLFQRQHLTPELLNSLGPGTTIAYDRGEGDPGRQYGPNHAEMTAINPETGILMVASKSSGSGFRWKPIDQNYINSLGRNAAASNPFNSAESQLAAANQQLAYLHQQRQPKKSQFDPDEGKIIGYADEPQAPQKGFFGQMGIGFMEELGSQAAKYGSLFSGTPDSSYQQEFQKWKEALGPPEAQPENFWGKVGRGIGSAGAMLPELGILSAIMPEIPLAGIAGRMANSALPFAAQSLTNPEAGLGDLGHSVALGAGMGVIPPSFGRVARGLSGAGIGGGIGLATHGDTQQAAADATVLGLLSALHGRRPEQAMPPPETEVPPGGGPVRKPPLALPAPGEPFADAEWYPGEPKLPTRPDKLAVPGATGQQLALPEYLPDFTMPVETRRRPGWSDRVNPVQAPEQYPIALEKGQRSMGITPESFMDMALRGAKDLSDTAGKRTGALPGQAPDRLAAYPDTFPTPEKIAAPVETGEVGGIVAPEVAPAESSQGNIVADLPTSRDLGSEGYIQAKKNPGGFYQLFFRGTTNEIFPGEKFRSANEARQYWKAEKVKADAREVSKPAEQLALEQPQAKEPWEMTKDEYVADYKARQLQRANELEQQIKEGTYSRSEQGQYGLKNLTDAEARRKAASELESAKKEKPDWWYQEDVPNYHKNFIKTALKEGKPVPPEVLKDYPDLAKAAGKTQDTGPSPDSLRSGLSLDDLKFLGKKVGELGDWLNKQFDKDTRYKFKASEAKPKAEPTPRNVRIDNKDMGMWRSMWDMPDWLSKDFPEFLNKHINDWRMRLYNQLKNPWFQAVQPVYALPRQHWDSLRNLMTEADNISRTMLKSGANRGQIDETINRFKEQFAPEVSKAAEAWWQTGSRIWKTIDGVYEKMGVSKTDIEKMRREMGYVPYYFPHMRFGKYLVTVRSGKDTIHAEGATNMLTRDRMIADLKKKYPGAEVRAFETKGVAEEVFFGLDDAHAAQLAKAALGKAGKLTPETEQAVMQALSDSLKERGFGRQFIKQKNIPGFETDDFHRVLTNYISGAAGFISKLKAAPEHVKALGNIDAKAKPRLYGYAERYVRDSLRNATRMDEVAGKMRGMLFHYFLGFNPKSAVLNLTQNISTGAPVLSTLKVKNPGMKILGAMRDITKDGKAYWDVIHGKEGKFTTLKENEARALKEATNRGWLDDVFTEEMMGMVGSRLGQSVNKFEKASRFLFGNAETLNRASMFLASFREVTKKGASFEDAMKQANNLTTMSHFSYGKYNLPEPVRAMGALGRTAYTFRSFNHNYMLLLRQLAKQDPAAFGRTIRNLALLGGVKAVPLVGAAFGIHKALTGQDLWQEAVQDKENNIPYILARFGVPGLAGIDASGSISVEIMRDLEKWSDLPKELLGAIGGVGENLANAADSYKRGDYYRTAEDLSPQAVRNVMGAYRKSTEGVTTRTGRQVLDTQGQPVKLSEGEAVKKGLGFQSVRPTIQREVQEYVGGVIEYQKDKADKWATRLVNAMQDQDRNTFNKVMTEVMDYNEKAVKRGEPPIDIENYVKRRIEPKLPVPKKFMPFMNQAQ
jgi:hypothetical protein